VDPAERARTALSSRIENSFTTAARQHGVTFGWEMVSYPAQTALLFNIPLDEGGAHEQYVMNTQTKAWCRFLDWPAETFAVFNGDLYYGGQGAVVRAWTGAGDNGATITANGKTAFTYMKNPGSLKRLELFRPTLAITGPINFLTGVDYDFADAILSGTAPFTTMDRSVWDVAFWDSAIWAAGPEVTQRWTSPGGSLGYCFATRVKVATNTSQVRWMSNDYIFQEGGAL
jgi:hypothetical protein